MPLKSDRFDQDSGEGEILPWQASSMRISSSETSGGEWCRNSPCQSSCHVKCYGVLWSDAFGSQKNLDWRIWGTAVEQVLELLSIKPTLLRASMLRHASFSESSPGFSTSMAFSGFTTGRWLNSTRLEKSRRLKEPATECYIAVNICSLKVSQQNQQTPQILRGVLNGIAERDMCLAWSPEFCAAMTMFVVVLYCKLQNRLAAKEFPGPQYSHRSHSKNTTSLWLICHCWLSAVLGNHCLVIGQ